MRTPEAKEQRRAEILNAALDEFFERGIEVARMEDIAARTGVTKGTLYLYFDSKEEIFYELVNKFAAPKIDFLENIVEEHATATASLNAIFDATPKILSRTKVPMIIKIIVESSSRFPELVANYRVNVVDRGLRLIERVLEKGNENGEFSIEDTSVTAKIVVAPIILSAIWKVTFDRYEKNIDIQRLCLTHSKLLIAALSK